MRQREGELERLKAQVLVVSFESQKRLQTLAEDLGLPWPVLSDVERKAYKLYGLERGGFFQVWNPHMMWAYFQLILRRRRFRLLPSDYRQLGGDFMVDGKGVVRYAFHSRGPTDRPDVEELMGALGTLSH